MSYVADDHSVIVRLDMARVRESPLSQEIATRVRRYPTWAALLGGSGIDPVDDFDRVLVTAPSAVTGRSVLVIRHHLTPQQVREAVLNVAVEQGARPEWREEGGFDVVDWPAPTDPPRVLIVASEQEMIVVTPEDLERALAVARDHALRRSGDEVIEPALHLEDGVVTTVAADEVESFVRGRFEHVPDRLEVELREDAEEEGRLRLRAHGIFADDAAAEAAHRYLSQQRDRYAGHMLVRAVGLDRPLMEATIEVAGNRLDVQASFTEEEMQRVFGLMELAELGGS